MASAVAVRIINSYFLFYQNIYVFISIKIPLKFVSDGQTDNTSALIRVELTSTNIYDAIWRH